MPRVMKHSVLINNEDIFVAGLQSSRCPFTLDVLSEGHDHQKCFKHLGSTSCSQEQFISSCVSSCLIPLRKGEKNTGNVYYF